VKGEAIPTAHGQTPFPAQGQATIIAFAKVRVAPIWYSTDFPNKSVIEICTTTYEVCEIFKKLKEE
jgi:hypothetical protein